MANIQFFVELDLIDKYIPAEDITVVQESYQSVEFFFDINKSGSPVDLTGATDFVFALVKPDGHVVLQNDAVLDNGKVKVVVNPEAFTAKGKIFYQIQYKIGTATYNTRQAFAWVEQGNTSCQALKSTDYAPFLDQSIELGKLFGNADNVPEIIAAPEVANSALAQANINTDSICQLENKSVEQDANLEAAKEVADSALIKSITNENETLSRTNEKPGVIVPPIDFTWKNAPLLIKKDTFGRYNTIFNIDSFMPAIGKAYYVDVTNGLDTNDGLTLGTAYKNLPKALQQADAKVIYIAPGIYDRNRGWVKTNPASNSLVVKALYPGTVTIGTHQDNLVWTLESGSVYKTTRSAAVNVHDTTDLDELGDFKEMIKKTSILEVESTESSWYTDGTTVYVHLKGNKVPDNSVRVYVTGGNGYLSGSKSLYVEGVKFYGGDNPFESLATSSSDNSKIYFKDCEFKYGNSSENTANGLTIKGTNEVYLKGCVASRNQRDGFNYHIYQNIIPKAIEVDCIAYKNGLNDSTNNNNGSTTHDAGIVIRVNGIYFGNKGINVADVGGAYVWCVGCSSYDSVSTSTSSEINFQNENGKTWLDGCVSYDSYSDVSEAGTGKVYSRRTLVSNKLRNTIEY